MSNRKFNLENEVQPEIHFRLLSISASKYENDWTSFPHSHHFTEIFFIKEGTGHMQIENELFRLLPAAWSSSEHRLHIPNTPILPIPWTIMY